MKLTRDKAQMKEFKKDLANKEELFESESNPNEKTIKYEEYRKAFKKAKEQLIFIYNNDEQ